MDSERSNSGIEFDARPGIWSRKTGSSARTRFDHLDGVGIRLALDGDDDGLGAVEESRYCALTSTPSVTAPISPSRTGAPSFHTAMRSRKPSRILGLALDLDVEQLLAAADDADRRGARRGIGNRARMSVTLRPCAASFCGSICTRTAYFCAPKMVTCATPGRVEMRCDISVSAYSFT
jgi:hypothetical protein